MTRILPLCALVLAGFVLGGAGCSGDPNVEGAKLDLRNRDYPKALTNVNAALAKNPTNAEALELKGDILTQQALAATDGAEVGRLAGEAATAYRAAASADPARQAAANRGVQSLYGQVYTKAVQAFNRGQTDAAAFAEAAGFFEAAGTIAPDSAAPYVYRGYSLLRSNREADAIEPLRMGIDKGFDEAQAYLTLAQLYTNASRPNDAITVLESAATKYPNEADLQRQLLQAYTATGQTDRAMTSYQERIAAEPANPTYRFNYGTLLLQAKRYDDAIQQLTEATRLQPDYANGFYNLGAAYINQAVDVNAQIQTKEDELRAQRASLSAAQRTEREAEIQRLVTQRTALFRQASTPLRQAHDLQAASGTPQQEVCRALFQSLVQTQQMQAAQQYSACAGM